MLKSILILNFVFIALYIAGVHPVPERLGGPTLSVGGKAAEGTSSSINDLAPRKPSWFICIQAPHMSGKSSKLVAVRDTILSARPEVVVVHTSALHLNPGQCFKDFFRETNQNYGWRQFLNLEEDCVLLVDEVQLITDRWFWAVVDAILQEQAYNGLRIVATSTHGSYSHFNSTKHVMLPVVVSENSDCNKFKFDIINLLPTCGYSGLLLGDSEVLEMTTRTVAEICYSSICNLSGGHVGVISAMVDFVQNHFRNNNGVSAEKVMGALESEEFLMFFKNGFRGVWDLKWFGRMVKVEEVPSQLHIHMKAALDSVATAEEGRCSLANFSKMEKKAVPLLLKLGALHQVHKYVQFGQPFTDMYGFIQQRLIPSPSTSWRSATLWCSYERH